MGGAARRAHVASSRNCTVTPLQRNRHGRWQHRQLCRGHRRVPAAASAAAGWNSSERHWHHLPVPTHTSESVVREPSHYIPRAVTKHKSLPSFVNFPIPRLPHHPAATGKTKTPVAAQAKLQAVSSSQHAMRFRYIAAHRCRSPRAFTLHAQGAECEIVILSLCRTNGVGAFVDSAFRVNVALTRARRHLWVCGHGQMLQRSAVWTE